MEYLLNAVPCGILVFNDSGSIVSVNEVLAKLLGYQSSELQGKSIETILTVASRIFYSTHLFPMIRLHQHADEIFLTLTTREKKDIPVLSNSVRLAKDAGFENIVALIPVFERKKYEQEILEAKRAAERAVKENVELQALAQKLEARTQDLERQNQRINTINKDLVQFSKIISHDLQEPIRKIKLFASVLASEAKGGWSERSVSGLAKIERSAEKLRKLTHGLQEYVNVDTEDDYSKVDLQESLSSAVAKVKKKREFDSFQILSPALPSIQGYPVQLELLFFHLIDNCVQFRKPDVPLVIKIEHTLLDENIYRSIPDRYKFVEHVRMIFSDNGSGFDNQYNGYVFDLAKKAHTDSKGVGLGLALIKKVVDNHGGTIRIESTPGTGTRVIVVLPLYLTYSPLPIC